MLGMVRLGKVDTGLRKKNNAYTDLVCKISGYSSLGRSRRRYKDSFKKDLKKTICTVDSTAVTVLCQGVQFKTMKLRVPLKARIFSPVEILWSSQGLCSTVSGSSISIQDISIPYFLSSR
jgi:hypothetical protein